MASSQNEYQINPLGAYGVWSSDASKHYYDAKRALEELRVTAARVIQEWPAPIGQALNQRDLSPELSDLVDKRDFLSDAVPIFAAMSVEGFLNFYGVLRLGETVYQTDFERCPLVPKLKALLRACDDILVADNAPIVTIARSVSEHRNSLAHPKTTALASPPDGESGRPVPDDAANTVIHMDEFFQQFQALVPEAAFMMPWK